MSHHDLNMRPAVMLLDGEEWVRKTEFDAVSAALREKQRTTQAHRHQFAAINDLWENLPARHADAPYAKSAEAFRKHGLIQTGFCAVDTIVCENHDAAKETAPVVAKFARTAHGYALIVVRDNLVICTTPESQSYKAMGKERFQASKQAVLEWGESLLGVRP